MFGEMISECAKLGMNGRELVNCILEMLAKV